MRPPFVGPSFLLVQDEQAELWSSALFCQQHLICAGWRLGLHFLMPAVTECHQWWPGHACLHSVIVPALSCGCERMPVHMPSMSPCHHLVAWTCMFAFLPCLCTTVRRPGLACSQTRSVSTLLHTGLVAAVCTLVPHHQIRFRARCLYRVLDSISSTETDDVTAPSYG